MVLAEFRPGDVLVARPTAHSMELLRIPTARAGWRGFSLKGGIILSAWGPIEPHFAREILAQLTLSPNANHRLNCLRLDIEYYEPHYPKIIDTPPPPRFEPEGASMPHTLNSEAEATDARQMELFENYQRRMYRPEGE